MKVVIQYKIDIHPEDEEGIIWEGVEEDEYNKLKHHDGNNFVLILVNSNKGRVEVSHAKTKTKGNLSLPVKSSSLNCRGRRKGKTLPKVTSYN
jgi:hypothetical protein